MELIIIYLVVRVLYSLFSGSIEKKVKRKQSAPPAADPSSGRKPAGSPSWETIFRSLNKPAPKPSIEPGRHKSVAPPSRKADQKPWHEGFIGTQGTAGAEGVRGEEGFIGSQGRREQQKTVGHKNAPQGRKKEKKRRAANLLTAESITAGIILKEILGPPRSKMR